MEMTQIARYKCGGGNCPAVFKTASGSIVIQGYELKNESIAAMNLPRGETALEVPLELILEAAKQLI